MASCCVKLSFVSPSLFLFVTLLFILELHFCSHSIPYHTRQRCIFKTNLFHLQVKYHPERLNKPHLSILPKSKSLPHGTEDTSAFDQVLSINWQMNTMLLTQVPCPVTPTFYPGSKLLALFDHTFAVYLFLCLIHADEKTSLCGSHQGPLDYGQTKLLEPFCEDDSYDYQMISDLPKHVFRSHKFYFVWYIQQLIVAFTTFSVPRSSPHTHQVSN